MPKKTQADQKRHKWQPEERDALQIILAEYALNDQHALQVFCFLFAWATEEHRVKIVDEWRSRFSTGRSLSWKNVHSKASLDLYTAEEQVERAWNRVLILEAAEILSITLTPIANVQGLHDAGLRVLAEVRADLQNSASPQPLPADPPTQAEAAAQTSPVWDTYKYIHNPGTFSLWPTRETRQDPYRPPQPMQSLQHPPASTLQSPSGAESTSIASSGASLPFSPVEPHHDNISDDMTDYQGLKRISSSDSSMLPLTARGFHGYQHGHRTERGPDSWMWEVHGYGKRKAYDSVPEQYFKRQRTINPSELAPLHPASIESTTQRTESASSVELWRPIARPARSGQQNIHPSREELTPVTPSASLQSTAPNSSGLRMCHGKHLTFSGTQVVFKGTGSLRAELVDGKFVPEDRNIYKFGGRTYRVSFPDESTMDVMRCVYSQCKSCNKSGKDAKVAASPTGGHPFAHRRELKAVGSTITFTPDVVPTPSDPLPATRTQSINATFPRGNASAAMTTQCYTCKKGLCEECDDEDEE